MTVITNYRLIPSVTFPGGSEDVLRALTWITTHLNDVGDVERIFIMGHSAGGVHVAGYLLKPSLYDVSIHVKGVILFSVPYEIPVINKTTADFRNAAEVYYAGAKKISVHQPLQPFAD
ncbi:hypothetical protein GLOTRDRAFT_127931 [Gloeophyllum trabeum ATCC 11539]|uniref:Alpha/beta hydrolase fold-3 domain-containing protein n=1 Tax=Gloeophyllum trabeum (strain ATCC 11539 / FP-39264 / Madison 617) TaxID=670483 RepID=S7QE60_GLOTA|nr:uncharacterized protein GLOTRDRAFT_127931 [Gloeophyllum trabeum ATCC 11539]EPQ57578.1 hypothetical protein GLOTRDRAFT_127931 [Gloeophyllum trabeum ATCC 11539]